MGSTYTNVTFVGAAHADVVRHLRGPAFVGAEDDYVVVFAEADEEDGPVVGSAIAAALGCVAVTVMVYDDDLLGLQVDRAGSTLLSGTIPDPVEVFGDEHAEFMEPYSPIDPDGLVLAVGRGDVDAVRSVLDGDFVFAFELHQKLATALGLPAWVAPWGYRYLSDSTEEFAGPALHQHTG